MINKKIVDQIRKRKRVSFFHSGSDLSWWIEFMALLCFIIFQQQIVKFICNIFGLQ